MYPFIVYRTAYGKALDSLPIRKAYTKDGFVAFCRERSKVEGTMSKELMETEHRRLHRFYRYMKVESAVAKMANLVAGEEGTVVLFENGSFKAQKGGAAVPRKKLVEEIARRRVLLTVPAAYTTASCPGCLRRSKKGVDYRTRRCETVPGSRPCSLHPDDPYAEFDRDAAGATNIGIRAVDWIRGLRPENFKPLTE